MKTVDVVNCKKFPVDAALLEQKLEGLDRVLVTKGKKLLELIPGTDNEDILKTAIGRSGNLRAPSLQNGKLLIVGFSEEAYQNLV